MKERKSVFNEKTGNPQVDNIARRLNRETKRAAKTTLKVDAAGWKRRKVVARVERDRWADIVETMIRFMPKDRFREGRTDGVN